MWLRYRKGVDIVFYEVFKEEREALQRHLPGNTKAAFFPLTIQESGHTTLPGGILCIRTQSVIPRAWERDIQAILTRSTGYDHVLPFLEASHRDIPAGYLPHYCSRAVAEHALMMWMALMRRLPAQIENLTRFDRDGLTGWECLGKTVAVVGVGSIGSEVCRLAGALGMEVLGVDIVRRHGWVRYTNLEDALARADVIVCSMNLTADNAGYFSYDVLKRAKPGAVFINVARGEFVRESDLLKLLEEGHLSGVGLDVYADEGALAQAMRSGAPGVHPGADAVSRLAMRKDVLCTPHNAFNTQESVERKAAQTVRQALHFLEHGTFIWNVPRGGHPLGSEQGPPRA